MTDPATPGRPDEPAQPSPPDARLRPAYGEYATPEEQRAAIRQPDAAFAADLGASRTGAAAPGAHRPLPHPETGPLPVPRPTTAAARPTRTADRIITVVLLVYGLFTVLSAVPQLWNFDGFAQSWMQLAGIDAPFTNIAQGELWGRIGAAVFVIGWLLTAVFSWRSLARRRLSWWIPLVGAIVTFVAASICLTVPLLGDPAVVAHFGG